LGLATGKLAAQACHAALAADLTAAPAARMAWPAGGAHVIVLQLPDAAALAAVEAAVNNTGVLSAPICVCSHSGWPELVLRNKPKACL
jgi:peptidyl-tRNA hydrolase